MKIVHGLGWYFPESVGGTETYVAALTRSLRSLGHEVLIAAPDARAIEARSYEHDGSEVFRYPIPARPTRDELRGDEVVRGAEELHEWLRRRRPDVFHCHSLVTGLGIPEIEHAKAAGARVVVTFHTPGLGYLCQRGTMMRWGKELCDGVAVPDKCAACVLQHRGLHRPLATLAASIPGLGTTTRIRQNLRRERRLLEEADAVVVLTEWARRAVEANLGPSSKVILNRLGVASGRFERAKRKGRSRPIKLGYLGRFDPIKGVLVLARAISRIPAELAFTLEVRGPFRSEEESSFRTLAGNDARVTFAPAVSPESVATVLASYDLLLCPSVAVEGGPTVALEAHAMGTPVVGSGIGGLAEIIEDGVNGKLLPPGDPASLASAIEAIVRDPGATIESWRKRIPKPRTMDDICRDYLEVYQPAAGEVI